MQPVFYLHFGSKLVPKLGCSGSSQRKPLRTLLFTYITNNKSLVVCDILTLSVICSHAYDRIIGVDLWRRAHTLTDFLLYQLRGGVVTEEISQ